MNSGASQVPKTGRNKALNLDLAGSLDLNSFQTLDHASKDTIQANEYQQEGMP